MERRPIASRQTKWASQIAAALARTGITPNTISVIGMLAAILAGGAFFLTGTESGPDWIWWIAGAALCQIRLLANLFDGMVAQIQNTASPVGELYNEVPDRISDAAIMIGFGYAAGSLPWLGWCAASLSIFVAYVRVQGALAGAPNDFCGPFAKPQRMALITIAAILTAFLAGFWEPIPVVALAVISVGALATAIRRLLRSARNLNRSSSPDAS
ncbi:MAG: phosphatidylglycerophosphate synthase [Verrucomicrobiales bacterium]|jgi:phosphatidylglycerophosphate synthase